MNPFDIEEQAEAIHSALVMPAEERRVRAKQLRTVVEHNSIDKWVRSQFDDIEAKLASERTGAVGAPRGGRR